MDMMDEATPGILSKMDEQLSTRVQLGGSDSVVSEPECEVHASNEHAELQGRLNNITSLGDLFVKQSQILALMEQQPEPTGYGQHKDSVASSDTISSNQRDGLIEDSSVHSSASCVTGCKSFEETLDEVTETLQRSYVENLREISPTSVIAANVFDQSSLHGFERMLDFEESDDIDSINLYMEGTDSEIQAAINEIRKEASQMDIVMALDQLKTVETELEVATRALRERSAEAEDLRQQLEEKEERVSCLELERDLFKADASKLRDDLKTCVDRMFDISAVAGSSSLLEAFQEGREEVAKVDALRDQAILRPLSSRPDSAIPPIPPSSPLDSASESGSLNRGFTEQPPLKSRSPPIRRMASASDPTTPARFMHRARDSPTVADAFPCLGAKHSSNFFRENPQTPSPNKTVSMSSMSTNSPHRRHRSFSEVIRSPNKLFAEADDDESRENRMCGLFRRRQQRRLLAKAKEVAIMRDKIDQLHAMMRASLETSEKLRKRLAMISRYYEGIIKKLQEQMVEVKTDKSRIRAEADSKISAMDHERRTTVIRLEKMLREQGEEIKALKQKLQAARVEI